MSSDLGGLRLPTGETIQALNAVPGLVGPQWRSLDAATSLRLGIRISYGAHTLSRLAVRSADPTKVADLIHPTGCDGVSTCSNMYMGGRSPLNFFEILRFHKQKNTPFDMVRGHSNSDQSVI